MKSKILFGLLIVILTVFAVPVVSAEDIAAPGVTSFGEENTTDDVIVTNESDIADEVNMSAEEKRRVEHVRQGIGLKNYVVNQQLLIKTTEAKIAAEVVISYIENNMSENNISGNVSELELIKAKLDALIDRIGNGTNITREEFIEMHKEGKEIVKEFRTAAHLIVTDGEDVSEIRKLIKLAILENKDELMEIKGKELRARKVYNIASHRAVMVKLNRHVAALEENGVVDVDMKKKYNQFKELEKQFIKDNLTTNEVNEIKTIARNKVVEIKNKRENLIAVNKAILVEKKALMKEVRADIVEKREEIKGNIVEKKEEIQKEVVEKKQIIQNELIEKKRLREEAINNQTTTSNTEVLNNE